MHTHTCEIAKFQTCGKETWNIQTIKLTSYNKNSRFRYLY